MVKLVFSLKRISGISAVKSVLLEELAKCLSLLCEGMKSLNLEYRNVYGLKLDKRTEQIIGLLDFC